MNDEPIIKHALHTQNILSIDNDDVAKVVIPLDENEYLKIEHKKLQKQSLISLRGIPTDKDGNHLVSSEPASMDNLKEVCKILGSKDGNEI